MLTYNDLSSFTRGYVDAIFFTDAGPDADPALKEKSFSDFSEKTLDKICAQCASFELSNLSTLEAAETMSAEVGRWYGREQWGHDFWLTRNGHGAGFWDRGLGALGDKLTEAANAFGNLDLYLGDDGKLYL